MRPGLLGQTGQTVDQFFIFQRLVFVKEGKSHKKSYTDQVLYAFDVAVEIDKCMGRFHDSGRDQVLPEQLAHLPVGLAPLLALAMLTIPGVAPLATSMLAGAGVMGIVLGVAAGPVIGNFIVRYIVKQKKSRTD